MDFFVTSLFVVWKTLHKNLLNVSHSSMFHFVICISPLAPNGSGSAVRVIYTNTYTVGAANYENPNCNCFHRQIIYTERLRVVKRPDSHSISASYFWSLYGSCELAVRPLCGKTSCGHYAWLCGFPLHHQLFQNCCLKGLFYHELH